MMNDQSLGIGGSGRGKLAKEIDVIRNALVGLTTVIGTGLAFYNQTDGQIYFEKINAVIDSIIDIARQNDKVRETLLRFATVSSYGQLVAAMSMLIVPILANHGVIPPIFAMSAGLSDETMSAILFPKGPKLNGNANS